MFHIKEYKHRRLICTLIAFVGAYCLHFMVYSQINIWSFFPFKATCIVFAIGGYRYSSKKYLDFNRKKHIFGLEMSGWAILVYMIYIYIFFKLLNANPDYIWIF